MNDDFNPKAIQLLRKALKMTQVQLSRKLKVDAITISRWERGEQRPTLATQRKLNRLLRKINS